MAWIKVSCVMLSWFGPGEATRCLLFFPPCPTSSRFCFNTSLSGIAVPFPLPSLICSVQFIHIASVEYVVSVLRILSFKASQLDSVHSWFCWGFNEINSCFCSFGCFCFQVHRLVRSMARLGLAFFAECHECKFVLIQLHIKVCKFCFVYFRVPAGSFATTRASPT